MQINVEGNKIGALRPQKFGWRIIGKGAKTFGIHALGLADQVIDEIGDGVGPAPAHDIGWDFIGDAEGKDCRIAAASIDCAPHCVAGGGPMLGRIEKTELFVPGNIDEQLELVLRRQIQEPLGGHVVDADNVGPQLANLGEIGGRLFRRREVLARGIGREWPVSNPLDVEFLFAKPEKLAIHAHPFS